MNKEEHNNLCNRFFDYVNSFRENDNHFCNLLDEKIGHIKRVTENALFIAQNEGWSEEDCLIAELCGLYHDIGRFSQYKEFKTFSDQKSVNHGQRGFDVINDNKLFEGIPAADSKIILDAVHYHNALNLPEDLSDESRRFANLTRDADKLDIFFMLTEAIKSNSLENHKDLLWNLPIGEANPVIIEKLMSNSQALYSDIKSGADVCLLQLCWLYGINYKSSFIKLKSRRTLELIDLILPQTSEIKACLQHINSYINDCIY